MCFPTGSRNLDAKTQTLYEFSNFLWETMQTSRVDNVRIFAELKRLHPSDRKFYKTLSNCRQFLCEVCAAKDASMLGADAVHMWFCRFFKKVRSPACDEDELVWRFQMLKICRSVLTPQRRMFSHLYIEAEVDYLINAFGITYARRLLQKLDDAPESLVGDQLRSLFYYNKPSALSFYQFSLDLPALPREALFEMSSFLHRGHCAIFENMSPELKEYADTLESQAVANFRHSDVRMFHTLFSNAISDSVLMRMLHCHLREKYLYYLATVGIFCVLRSLYGHPFTCKPQHIMLCKSARKCRIYLEIVRDFQTVVQSKRWKRASRFCK